MPDDREYVETTKMDVFYYTVPDGSDDYKKGFQDGVDFVLDRFYELPREDVAPVIHGNWMPVKSVSTDGTDGVYTCSWCGKTANSEYDYCPNCGATMVVKNPSYKERR